MGRRVCVNATHNLFSLGLQAGGIYSPRKHSLLPGGTPAAIFQSSTTSQRSQGADMKDHIRADLHAREISQVVRRTVRNGARSGFAAAAIGVGISGWPGAQPALAAEANEAASSNNQLQ